MLMIGLPYDVNQEAEGPRADISARPLDALGGIPFQERARQAVGNQSARSAPRWGPDSYLLMLKMAR